MAEYIRKTLVEDTHFADSLAKSNEKLNISDVPDVSGKVLVITGGSDGIGFATVHTWLSKGASKAFVLSGTEHKAEGMREALEKDLGKEKADRVTWHQVDLADWNAVTEAAGKIAHATDRIDALVLNAARGIMTAQKNEVGVDRHFAANHIGHVTLASHLLPIIKKTAEHSTVRISIQSSNLHEQVPKDQDFKSLDDVNKDLGPNSQYGRSKLCNLLYARYLARHLSKENPNILANATHPGFVDTTMSAKDIHEPFPFLGYLMSSFPIPQFKKDIWQGCVPTLYCSIMTKQTGQYICPPVIVEPGSDKAQDAELGERLMKLTEEIVASKTTAKQDGCPVKGGDLSLA